MHQPLASVYFHCCLKQLDVKLTAAEFTYVLGLVKQYDLVGVLQCETTCSGKVAVCTVVGDSVCRHT